MGFATLFVEKVSGCPKVSMLNTCDFVLVTVMHACDSLQLDAMHSSDMNPHDR